MVEIASKSPNDDDSESDSSFGNESGNWGKSSGSNSSMPGRVTDTREERNYIDYERPMGITGLVKSLELENKYYGSF